MDATKTLDEIRELIAMHDDPKQNIWSDNSYAMEVVEKFRDLDEWLSKGGFYPLQWKQSQRGGGA